MDSLLDFTTFFVGVITFLLSYYWYRKPKRFPPGPRGFPLIGIIPFLGRFPEKVFQKWTMKYGPIMSVRMGRDDIVVLNDYESIQQAFAKGNEVFSGRPYIPFFERLLKGFGLSFLNYGPRWKTQRKFGATTLRGLGVGKKSMEERIAEEVTYLNEAIRSHNGEPFDILHSLKTAVSNNICNILFGKRFQYDDPKFENIMYRMEQGFNSDETLSLTRILVNAPILINAPPYKQRFATLLGHFSTVEDLIAEIVEDHKQSFDENNLRDFIDAFLLEMKKNTHESFQDGQLPVYCINLFLAGTEPASNTLRWGLLLLLHYPEIQKKLRSEILNNLGTDGKFLMANKADFPYARAFIQELFRFRPVVPLAPFHYTTEDAELEGYLVPKNTKVIANLWAAMRNPKDWKDPNTFNPERHLDEDGKFIQSPRVIPFSVGPRHCLGEQLARVEMFVILISMLQKFEFYPDPNASSLPVLDDGLSGLAFFPFSFKLVAKEIN